MTLPTPSIIRCKTLREARAVFEQIPAGHAELSATNIRITRSLEVSFTALPTKRVIPLSDGPSIIQPKPR